MFIQLIYRNDFFPKQVSEVLLRKGQDATDNETI